MIKTINISFRLQQTVTVAAHQQYNQQASCTITITFQEHHKNISQMITVTSNISKPVAQQDIKIQPQCEQCEYMNYRIDKQRTGGMNVCQYWTSRPSAKNQFSN